MGFSRQEYWSGLPCPSPGDLPDSGINPTTPASPAPQVDSLPLYHKGSPRGSGIYLQIPTTVVIVWRTLWGTDRQALDNLHSSLHGQSEGARKIPLANKCTCWWSEVGFINYGSSRSKTEEQLVIALLDLLVYNPKMSRACVKKADVSCNDGKLVDPLLSF